MPQIIPAVVGAAVTAGVGGALAGSVLAGTFAATALASVAGGLASNLVGGFFTKNPKAPEFTQQQQSRSVIVRSAIEPYKVVYGRQRVSGPLALVTTTKNGAYKTRDNVTGVVNGTDNYFLHMVIPLAAHECQEIEAIYLNDQRVTLDSDGYDSTSNFIGKSGTSENHRLVRIITKLGTDGQTAIPEIISELPEYCDANFRLRGLCYAYVRLEWSPEVWANGVPQFRAVIKGKKVYDPRTTLTAYSNNAALCVRDYLTNTLYGIGALSTEINDDDFISAANICDENVTLADGTTQKRYTCDSIIDCGQPRGTNIQQLATAFAGSVAYSSGQYLPLVGAFTTPTVTVDESWLRGPLQMRTKLPSRERFNTVKGTYINETAGWQATEFYRVTNAAYVTADDGEEILQDIQLPCTIDNRRARRLALIKLLQGRLEKTMVLPCNLKALQLRVGDTVLVDNDILGISQQTFRILEWTINAGGGVDLFLKEDNASAYAWTAASDQEDFATPFQTTLPDPFLVSPPGAPVATEELYVTVEGGTKSKAAVSWAASTNSFVTLYELQYKLSTSSTYLSAGTTADLNIDVMDLDAGLYNLRVRAINGIGQSSEWVGNTVLLLGKTAPPSNISNFSINEIAGTANLSWDIVTDVDVRVGGRIRLRYSRKTSGATWSEAIDTGPSLPGTATNVAVPLVAGTYLIKAVDSSGNESTSATSITISANKIVDLTTNVTVNEHSAFSGTKTNMVVLDSALQLQGATLFDDALGDFDDAEGFFDYGAGGGFNQSGGYVFANTVDLGNIYRVRVSIDINALSVDGALTFDQAGGLFDSRLGLFDGDDITGSLVKLFIRTTDDDTTASPTWSAWRQFTAGDYTARGFQFKLEVTTDAANINVKIDYLSVIIEVPRRLESAQDVASNAAGSTITYSKPFLNTPTPQILAQNLATGDYYAITTKTASSFFIRFFNSGGTGISRTFDWTVFDF